ncbi:hypothetical protein AWH56_023305 [Anaerobacillus isosaccharinicus]|uniref:Uncharacterized protein n=1 Tax=Anaerobacillus isosaccharinicus TaxID=1532552 RepID=A0A1S2LI50_9BACI|nr:hypothetical protein [Anaerobacillus isosaccharinicus]MBA5586167.1 hypothetical protein [Anaerobacillus isosaccharinicus]QOY35568.1 hypothetical protein AWH56_023305 [Anaerobacillus isosaccharinicus]
MNLNLDKLTLTILELANRLIGTRTFFISMLGNEKYTIIKVLNTDGCDIEEGAQIPINETL